MYAPSAHFKHTALLAGLEKRPAEKGKANKS
jgi:hypothetical protein